MEFSSLKNNIILECERTEDKLMHTWYPSIINLFADKDAFTGIKPDKQESFYNCVTTLISNQVPQMCMNVCGFMVFECLRIYGIELA